LRVHRRPVRRVVARATCLSSAAQPRCVHATGRAVNLVSRSAPAGQFSLRRIGMNALTLIKDEHKAMKKLLSKLESTTERGVKEREELFGRIKTDLTLHEIMEEEIFYPALRDHPKAKDIVLEAYEEHNVVDTILSEMADLPFDDETWGAKAKVMQENVEHHMEEEEGEMFRKARQVFDEDELEELGERMARRRAEAARETAGAAR
jgi:hemerythrin superfamily protein